MATQTPIARAAMQPGKQVTQVPVSGGQFKVTYIVNATSAKGLKIPYAVAINGKVLPEYAAKPSRVIGDGGKVVAFAESGDKVSLFLNSDAHPAHRKAPVYAVTVESRNVEVRITEKKGKSKETDTPKKVAGNGSVDAYSAVLTGDIWMKVSHAYTVAEVDALLPAGTNAPVAAAVRAIYAGLKSQALAITVPAQRGRAASQVDVRFEDSANPKDNICSYALLSDGLPRVHPAGFAAILNAAVESGVASLNVTSCWRPVLGSIAHRAGLGLDVNFVGRSRMNRQELGRGKGNGNDADNVSDAEIKAFRELEVATEVERKTHAALKQADKSSKAAGLDPAAKAEADRKLQAARAAADASSNVKQQKRKAWDQARDAAEPPTVKLFRLSLLRCESIAQLFDPWFMDANTQDAAPPTPNMQKSSNETLHAHHLHVTVREPKIL